MAGDWVEKTIGDIATVVGGSTPSTRDPANFDGDIPWLTPKDLAGPHPRYITRGERNLSRLGLERCSAQILPANSVLLSSRAPIGYLAIARNPLATNQGFRSLVVKPGYDHEFMYYWLFANVAELERHATGSTFKELSGSALKQIRIRLPSALHEQRAIAHILGTLDDKIELNRRMSETLEAMVRALFKAWFVDFEPVRAKMEGRWRRGETLPGLPAHLYDLFPDRLVDSRLGEIPEGWSATTLAEFACLNPESWTKHTRPELIRYVDLSNTKWGRIENVTEYIAEEAPSRAQRVLRSGDTIVGTVRPGNGSYALIVEEGLTGSTGFAVLRPLRSHYIELVYLAATVRENIEALSHMADGGAYPAVRPEVVSATQVWHPKEELICEFSQRVASMLAGIADPD